MRNDSSKVKLLSIFQPSETHLYFNHLSNTETKFNFLWSLFVHFNYKLKYLKDIGGILMKTTITKRQII